MSVKIIFYDLNQPDTTPVYKELVKYLMGLDDWTQPLSTVWVVDTPKSAQVLRDEIKPFITETDRFFIAEWYPGSGWASRNIPPVAAEWIRMREGEENIDQYKLPPSMIPPEDPNYTPPPPPQPSEEFLRASGEIPREDEEEASSEPAPTEPAPVETEQTETSDTEPIAALDDPATDDTSTTAPENPAGTPEPQQAQTISIEHEESQPVDKSNGPPASPPTPFAG